VQLVWVIIQALGGIAGITWLAVTFSLWFLLAVVGLIVYIYKYVDIRELIWRGWRFLRANIIIGSPPPIDDINEIEQRIKEVNLASKTAGDLAKELQGYFKVRHLKFNDKYACEVHFDIHSLSCSLSRRESLVKHWIQEELINRYSGKQIKKILFLQRWGAKSGLLTFVGEEINAEVIPIPERIFKGDLVRLSDIRVEMNDRIVIVEPLAMGDDCLRQVYLYFRDRRKAEIIETVCLFDVVLPATGREKPIPSLKSLITLDLGVHLREKCLTCRFTRLKDYY